MGPKVKKPFKNAFSFFLDDYVDSLKANGRNVSRKLAAEECGLIWKELSEIDKAKYNNLAHTFKGIKIADKEHKYTTTGISFAQLEREQEKLREKIKKADNEIKMTISHLDSDSLKTHLFYLIHCNYYCRTSDGIYVPGELAIAEFNLGDGVRRTYHTLINPGEVPLGYASDTKQTIEEIHGLPYPPFEEGDSNYFGILDNILQFIEPGKLPDGRYPPFYCIENNIKACENILQALSESVDGDGGFFRVYLLHKMFFWLKNKCVEYHDEENINFPVISVAESEVNKDVFRYTPGISCAFHVVSEDKYQNCSLSVVQRYIYLICDHCCQYVDVKIIPGKHCRMNCDTDREATRAKREAAARALQPPIEVELKRRSSYADDLSTVEWEKEGAGSFLHDEIESKFGSFDVYSVTSNFSRNLSTSTFKAGSIISNRGENEDNEEDEVDTDDEDFKKFMSLGRGSMRF